MKTLYRVFDSRDQAERVMNDLTSAGFSVDQIALLSVKPDGGGRSMSPIDLPGGGRISGNRRMRDMFDVRGADGGVPGALSRLGVASRDLDTCTQALRNGGTFEAVTVDDANLGRARQIFERAGETAEEIVIPVIREELAVGTREVDAGGVRVTSHVREVPVERTISIHEEHVTIERHVVDRAIDGTDGAFRDRTFEMRGSADEPVVTKRAHVVEEIHVRKDRQDKIGRVEDTVRQTEVEVSELPSERKR